MCRILAPLLHAIRPGTERSLCLSRLRLAAGHPGGHSADHLVGDGAEALGPLAHLDTPTTLGTEQHHLVPGLYRIAGVGRATVDHQLVHGDRAQLSAELADGLGARYVSSKTSGLAEVAATHGPFDVMFEASGFSPLVFEAMDVLGGNGVLVLASVTNDHGEDDEDQLRHGEGKRNRIGREQRAD